MSDQLFVQEASSLGAAGAQTALVELQALKDRFDSALLEKKYNEFSFRNFRFDVTADVVSAGGFNPTHNLGGHLIQDLIRLEQPSENLLFSILPTRNGLWVSFLWPSEYSSMHAFVEDFAQMATVGAAYGVALAFVENSFIRPSALPAITAHDPNIITRLALMGVVNHDYRGLPDALQALARYYPAKPVEMIGT